MASSSVIPNVSGQEELPLLNKFRHCHASLLSLDHDIWLKALPLSNSHHLWGNPCHHIILVGEASFDFSTDCFPLLIFSKHSFRSKSTIQAIVFISAIFDRLQIFFSWQHLLVPPPISLSTCSRKVKIRHRWDFWQGTIAKRVPVNGCDDFLQSTIGSFLML